MKSRKSRMLALGVFAAVVMAFVVAPALTTGATAQAAARTTTTNPTLVLPISGTGVPGTSAAGDTFTGTFTVQHFTHQGRALFAEGVLNGTITNAAGQTVKTVSNVPATLPVTSGDPTCSILNLTLGPLDLNLLGLMIHLNQVVLTITAQSGPGNLLGNLLCAVANLLNNGAPLGALTGLLNHVIDILNGL